MLRPTGILETILYAENLDDAREFYEGVLGIPLVGDGRPLMLDFRVSDAQVLLVFDPRQSGEPGREVPSHACAGPGHVAFLIEPGSLDAWRERLAGAGVEIEREIAWTSRPRPAGADTARSVYVRDPAGNSVELITADIWRREPS